MRKVTFGGQSITISLAVILSSIFLSLNMYPVLAQESEYAISDHDNDVTLSVYNIPEKNCKTNPEMEGCKELPNTGPLEIILATLIVLGICGAGFCFYRTQRVLKTVEGNVSGKDSSQKPNDMV